MTTPRAAGLRLDALASQAREPAFVLGPDRRVVGVNRALEELTGHAADRLVGVTCLPTGPVRGDLAGVGGSLCPPPEALAGRPAGGTALIIHAGGERRWRRVEFWPFHDADGKLLGLFGLVRPADAARHAPDSDAHRLRGELLEVRARLERRHGFDTLIGRGPAHRRLLEQARAAAATAVPVLIVGEPGSGRRTVARAIHALGTRRQAPLLPFDTAALPPEVLDRSLFGARDDDESAIDPDSDPGPGEALDDDDRRRAPRLALPEGATLLLGDLLELPRDLQARLARALDGRVRLIAITAGDPDAALRADRIRPDLYYATTAMVLRLRPLRERVDEVPLLAQHLLERANGRGGRQREGFAAEAVEALVAYDWPGNLRELARVVDAAHAQAADDRIEVGDLPSGIRGHLGAAYLPPPAAAPAPLDEVLTQVERRLIERALERARHNKSRAAELLGISRPRLYRRIKELGLPDEPEAPDPAASPGPTPP